MARLDYKLDEHGRRTFTVGSRQYRAFWTRRHRWVVYEVGADDRAVDWFSRWEKRNWSEVEQLIFNLRQTADWEKS